MKKEAKIILADIDRRYVQLSSGSDDSNLLPLLLPEFQLHPSSQVYANSTRAVASSSGLVMTWRHLWRYWYQCYILHPANILIFTDIPTHAQRICSQWYDLCTMHISWLLLLSALWCSWYSIPCSHARCSQSFPSISRNILYMWYLLVIQSSSSTFTNAFHSNDSIIWCPKQTLFIYHGVKTHQGHQETLLKVKSL